MLCQEESNPLISLSLCFLFLEQELKDARQINISYNHRG